MIFFDVSSEKNVVLNQSCRSPAKEEVGKTEIDVEFEPRGAPTYLLDVEVVTHNELVQINLDQRP